MTTTDTRRDLAEDVARHHAQRLARLTAPTGWLTLIQKVWLDQGEHTVGAAAGAAIALPEGRAPDRVGVVVRRGDEIVFEAAPDVEVMARGQRITSLRLHSDADPNPDRLTIGPFSLELIRRGDAFAIRVRDPENPARRAFSGIPTYPVDADWLVRAPWEAFAVERAVVLPDNDDRPQTFLSPGTAVITHDGKTARVELVYEEDRRRLWLLFADTTNRTETYGAGRFLYAPLPVDGHVVLDFNRAFNPPCAFTSFASCPLPPPANRLPFAVTAGEKRPAQTG